MKTEEGAFSEMRNWRIFADVNDVSEKPRRPRRRAI
jgi:hypothetical protein